MFLLDMLVALVLAVIITSVLVALRPRDGMSAGLLFAFFFLISFPMIWAAGTWMVPVGPPFAGVSWLGYLVAGLFLLALILAILPPSRRSEHGDAIMPAGAKREALEGTAIFFGLFFWILLLAAAVALIVRYGVTA
jgi:hypothetical protein